MIKILFSLFLFCSGFLYGQKAINSSHSTGYNIKVTFKPFKNEMIYFGRYFGNKMDIVDSTILNENSEAVLKSPKKLPSGVYVIFFPDNTGRFNVLMDQNQHFSINGELTYNRELILKFINSPENEVFKQYELFIAKNTDIQYEYKQKLIYADNAKDSASFRNILDSINQKIDNYKERFIKNNPKKYLSNILITMREPQLPKILRKQKNKQDSILARSFIKNHYWDGMEFGDSSYAYTPFFIQKLNKYFKEVIGYNTDTIIKEIDEMLIYSRVNNTMTHLLLENFINEHTYHYYHWNDSVFTHIFEKHIAPTTYAWMSSEDRKSISDKAYYLMGKMIGSPAYEIELENLDGKKISLSQSISKYTILAFWDPVCHHCRETLPMLDSMYKNSWKEDGVKIFSVATESDGTIVDWKNYIEGHHLQEWQNVYYPSELDRERASNGLLGYPQLYDVWYYPSFFVLDQDKKFIAKKLTYPQLVDFLKIYLNH